MFSRLFFVPNRLLIKIPPPAVLALLYGGCIITGATLLKLPFSLKGTVSWSDAIFTATSAATVTGLTVVDIGSHFTLFGQIIIVMLIQLGGLGLMTFGVLVLSLLRLPIGLPHMIFLREDLNQTSIVDLLQLVRLILRVVVACEAIGTILLAIIFIPEFGTWPGLWHALFHAISAFNNAGLGLFPDNLARWATNPLMNITVPALIIIGGIGFSVLSDLYLAGRWRTLSLHTKLMLSGTAALIVLSVAAFAVLECTNPLTLGQLSSAAEKLTASWFQGVTTRTAGFNTIDIGGLHDSTALMFISLMLIGGGSTSTAGVQRTTLVMVNGQLPVAWRQTVLNKARLILALVLVGSLAGRWRPVPARGQAKAPVNTLTTRSSAIRCVLSFWTTRT